MLNAENELDHLALLEVIGLIYIHTGITMSEQKKALISSRLRKRLRALSFSSYGEYIDYLKSNDSEIEQFVNVVTTNETSFFRTARIWNHFNQNFLPEWYAKNAGKTLSIWSAAASSGEEVYTIAICCYEFKLKNPLFNYQIFATDISTDVLNEAKEAVYSGRSIELFQSYSKSLFEQYMKSNSADTYVVRDHVRANIEFQRHNLFTSLNRSQKFDIVFLRNVLIYFEAHDQEKVLKNIERMLKPEGHLVLGESDSLTRLETNYAFQSPCLYKVGA